MNDSIFTKIIRGEIPCYKVYEDDRTFAFLDIHPVTPGHVLVIPKQQVQFVWDLPESDYRALMDTCQQVALHMRKKLAVPYVGSKIEGVDVPHAHVHLIPFTMPDQFHATPDMASEPDHVSLQRMAQVVAL